MTIQEALDYLNQYRNAGNHIHREAMDMAIEVLEKKIAKKPIEKWTGDEWVIKCPVCGKYYFDVSEYEWARQFCGCCGQKIDWSDAE